MNREAKNILDIPLSIEQYYKELDEILQYQNIYNENRVKIALKKSYKKVAFPDKYGDITGKYDISVNNSENKRSIIFTRERGKPDDRIEIELNPPILMYIEPDLKQLNERLSDISSDIYVTHSNIINLYTLALDKTVDSELEKMEKSKLSIEAFEKKRRQIPELDDLLKRGAYKNEHAKLRDTFSKLHDEYVSVYSDIEYLKGLKNRWENNISVRLEMCNILEYYLSQRLRIVYSGLCTTISNLSETDTDSIKPDELLDFEFREYSLKFDKNNGKIYANLGEDGLDLVGELENYNIRRYIDKKNNVVKRKVSPFLVKKLLLKYLYLKRLLGYHIRQDPNRRITRGDLVSFINDGVKNIGLVISIGTNSYRIDCIDENINFMDDTSPVKKYDISKEDVERVLPVREEILQIKKMKSRGLTYNYELYVAHTKRKGRHPEIPLPSGIDSQLLKHNLYPSLTIKTITKPIKNRIGRVLRDRIPDMSGERTEPLLNMSSETSLSDLVRAGESDVLNSIFLLLKEDAITKSQIENIEYVSNILETLKRRERVQVEENESKTSIMFGGADDNTIFNDFKVLDHPEPSSVVENVSFEMNGGDNFEEYSKNSDSMTEVSINDTEQYGGMDVKNIYITEKI